MSASYGDNTIAESILAGFPYLIDVEPTDLAPLRIRPNLRERSIEDGKRYAHSSGFSPHGDHRPLKFECNDFQRRLRSGERDEMALLFESPRSLGFPTVRHEPQRAFLY